MLAEAARHVGVGAAQAHVELAGQRRHKPVDVCRGQQRLLRGKVVAKSFHRRYAHFRIGIANTRGSGNDF